MRKNALGCRFCLTILLLKQFWKIQTKSLKNFPPKSQCWLLAYSFIFSSCSSHIFFKLAVMGQIAFAAQEAAHSTVHLGSALWALRVCWKRQAAVFGGLKDHGCCALPTVEASNLSLFHHTACDFWIQIDICPLRVVKKKNVVHKLIYQIYPTSLLLFMARFFFPPNVRWLRLDTRTKPYQ